MTRNVRFLLAALATSLASCGGQATGPAAGEEKGKCYANSTCDQGLVCFSNLCVRYDAGAGARDTTGAMDAANSSGGAGAIGASGGAGGATGAAGATGLAGEGGAAGAAGAGGVVGTADAGRMVDAANAADSGRSADAGALDASALDAGAPVDSGHAADAGGSDACSGVDETSVPACGNTPGTTSRAYSGLVTMTVSGLFVNSPGNPLEDAFYGVDLNDNSLSAGACPECFRYNRLSEGLCLCSYECAATSHPVSELLVDPYPAFNPSHTYSVTLDLGSAPPQRINFGMADCGCFDNSGTHTVTITPLTDAVCVP